MSDAEDVVRGVREAGIEAQVVTDYGWPGQIELALVDSVMSIRARYGTETSGVLGRVLRYRSVTKRNPLDDLTEFSRLDPEELRDLLGLQRSGGRLKSEICLDVAQRLVDAGVVSASDVEADRPAHKLAWTGTVGLGWVTWEYFTMLLGHPGVKADTMVNRFVSKAIGVKTADAKRAHGAVTGAAELLGVQARDLDHAIWRHESGRSVRR
ncbi:hypothetical protein FE634_02285 [Nocardioides dongxiaopingii]|uniref:hypothetical protein n=1 Tax=Nocardioides sp. S-1144 TaxID=2582905 RepID=UPI00110E863D|nr:hypothetical protein [Nocardioides sp. S-1144]QCW49533.1 hypothetical protein FE634_02285 [Nocardioides sp. S-1144]